MTLLFAQQNAARGEEIGRLKAEGVEYDERMAIIETISWPKPLEELLTAAFSAYAAGHPWLDETELAPKAVVRDLFERAMTFAEYVSFYQLQRSEGLVLRYLSDAYRAIRQTVPAEARTDELVDIIEWLGELVRQVDSSLIDEWSALVDPSAHLPEDDGPVVPPAPPSVLTNRRAFTVLVRNELFRRVQLAALQDDDALVALDPEADWSAALDAYYDEHDEIGTGGPARHGPLAHRADDRRPGGPPRLAHPRRGRPRGIRRAGHRRHPRDPGSAPLAPALTSILRRLARGGVARGGKKGRGCRMPRLAWSGELAHLRRPVRGSLRRRALGSRRARPARR